ncbi:MAG: zinc ribbon domain-containing protein [Erysipelotrichales bacterium]|nr:zinc ribbon domain-containing protein [Erysipelotrichales bacterium]
MYCSKCGKLLPENSNFCPSCGARVIRVEEEPVVSEEPIAKEAPEVPEEEPVMPEESAEEAPEIIPEENKIDYPVEEELSLPEEPVVSEEPAAEEISDTVKEENPEDTPAEEEPVVSEEIPAEEPQPEEPVKKEMEEPAIPPKTVPKKKNKLPIILAILALLIAGGIGGYYLYQNSPKVKFAKIMAAAEEKAELSEAMADYKAALELDVDNSAVFDKMFERIQKAGKDTPSLADAEGVYRDGINTLREIAEQHEFGSLNEKQMSLIHDWFDRCMAEGDIVKALSAADLVLTEMPEEYREDAEKMLYEAYSKFVDQRISESSYSNPIGMLQQAAALYKNSAPGFVETIKADLVPRIITAYLSSKQSALDKYCTEQKYGEAAKYISEQNWYTNIGKWLKEFDYSVPYITELKNGKIAGFYMADRLMYFYYGEGKDLKRSGKGLWILIQKNTNGYRYYSVYGDWANDLPNGDVLETDNYKTETSTKETTVVTSGKVKDGLYDGDVVRVFNGTEYKFSPKNGIAESYEFNEGGVHMWVVATNGSNLYGFPTKDYKIGLRGFAKN